ncbi:hypothetical protein [Alkalimarinus alittae]|uniref:SpoIIAA-like n=1 Tax=Alkalimarinus alittae TaxID=2961619 RepID=A0ABY6N7A4_9ALTE|nr:hypothetical protein [Alkalimarinus alittae]UZE97900.1 hypothetical protein NKI27_09245 [Alkalimarinus alittae]
MSEVLNDKFTIRPVHDILYVSLIGSWSTDDTLNFVADYKRLVSKYFAQEWACVLQISDLEMLIGEDFQQETLKALNTWGYIKGMGALAIIVGHKNRDHLLFQFEEILKGKQSFQTGVFRSNEDADAWLRLRGFKAKLLVEESGVLKFGS